MKTAIVEAADAEIVLRSLENHRRRWFKHIFSPYIEQDLNGLIALAAVHLPHGQSRARPRHVQLFPCNDGGIEDCVAFAQQHGVRDVIWCRPGLIRPDIHEVIARRDADAKAQGKRPGGLGAILDDDIIALSTVWIDCDEPHHFRRFDERDDDTEWPLPSFHVITGTQPSLRRQSYWRLEAVAQNIAAWKKLAVSMTAAFGCDAAVVNPSRYLKVPGSIAHIVKAGPKAEGRVRERVIAVPETGEIFDFEELQAAPWPEPERSADIISDPALFGQPAGWTIDSGDGRSDESILALLEAAKADGHWHIGVRDAVATLVGRGDTDLGIHAWLYAYGRTDHGLGDPDVQALIDGARRKFQKPDRGRPLPPAPEGEEDIWGDLELGPEAFARPKRIVDFDDIDSVEDPPEILEGVLVEGGLYGIIAPPKCGKSFVAADMAHALATGRPWFGRRTLQSSVVYAAAERGYMVLRRYKALRIRRPPEERAPIRVVGGYFDLIRDDEDHRQLAEAARGIERASGVKCRALIVDTAAQTMGGGNDVEHMPQLVASLQKLRDDTGLTIIVVHHTAVGDATRARGRSDFTGAVDGLYRCEPLDEEPHALFRISAGPSNAGSNFVGRYRITNQDLGQDDQWGKPQCEGVLEPLTAEEAGDTADKRAGPWDVIGLDLSQSDAPLRRLQAKIDELEAEGLHPAQIARRDQSSDAWVGYLLAEALGIDLGARKSRPAKRDYTDEQNHRRWAMGRVIDDLIQQEMLRSQSVLRGKGDRYIEVIRVE